MSLQIRDFISHQVEQSELSPGHCTRVVFEHEQVQTSVCGQTFRVEALEDREMAFENVAVHLVDAGWVHDGSVLKNLRLRKSSTGQVSASFDGGLEVPGDRKKARMELGDIV